MIDRTLVVKSYLPPEDKKVLWLDISKDPKLAKLWNPNTGRWESVVADGEIVDIYLGDIKEDLREEKERSQEADRILSESKVGVHRTNSFDLLLDGKDGNTLYPYTQVQCVAGALGGGKVGNSIYVTKDGEAVYPRTKSEYVEHGDSNVGTIIDSLEEISTDTKKKVDTFLQDADTSSQAIDKLKELQEYIKSDKTSAAKMLQDISDNKANIEAEATRAKEAETYLETQKADKTGYYKEMSVGVADNLVGRDEAIEREFIFDPSGGAYNNILEEDTARIERIQGNSIVYEGQIINNNTTAIKTVGLNIVNTSGEILLAPNSSQKDPKTWAEVGKIYTGIRADGPTYPNNTNPDGTGYIHAVRNDDGSFTVTNNVANYALGFFCKVLPNTTYTSRNTHASPQYPRVMFLDKNKVYLSFDNILDNTFTTPYNCEYIFLLLFTFSQGEVVTSTFENPVIHLKNTGYMDGKYAPYPAYREETKQLPTIEGGLRSIGDVCDELKYNHNTKRWEHIKRIEERVYQAGDESNADVLTDGTTTYIKAETQTITELDSELSPDYKVWDWGTEEAIQVEPSTPFKASIKYGFNAVDQIRGNKLRIEELSKTSVTEEELQLSTNAITNVYPSGDPMHMAYVAAGAVWDESTQTWSANGRSGLSNSEIRSLYNKADMDELLFRKLWNSCNALSYENNKVKYDETTGFYRANGVWHIGYEEALEIFAKNPYARMGIATSSSGINYFPITTLPMMSSSGGTMLYYEFTWQKRIVDLRMICYNGDGSGGNGNVNKTYADTYDYAIGYCYNIRIIRDWIMNQVSRPNE